MIDNQYIASARAAYQARDFQTALALFGQCIADPTIAKGPGDVGYLYHQLGNCYLQLQQFDEAINAYTQATADSSYDACGAVNCNLAKAYAFLHDYEDAVEHFEIAVSDAKYDAPYKAYLGMGNALLKLGKNAEAGVAFREAALDARNPDPTKALLNLGVCFMALNRPADAVQSYESALQFDMDPATRNKMYANLGQAYVACNQMQKAMSAFEAALADKTYFLSESASVDYSLAAKAVATGTAAMQPLPGRTQAIEPQSDMSGLDVAADGAPLAAQDPYYTDPQYFPAEAYGYDVQDGYASGDDRFFNASDEELEQWSRGLAKQERKRKNVGLKILVVIVLLVLAAFAASVFLYTQGWGYPSAQTVVEELFADPQAASSTLFADEVEPDSAATMTGQIAEGTELMGFDGVDASMSETVAYVTAETPEGGQMQYKVSLVRDLIGWKVSNIELYFASQN